MNLPLSKVSSLEDFSNKEFQSICTKYKIAPNIPNPFSDLVFNNRKAWEIAMALYSFDKFNLLSGEKEFLGIGVAKEQTISILSNYAKRVFATDIYLNQGSWESWHDGNLLIDARKYMDSNYNHRKVVWQHVDGRDLPYEDNSFDGIFSCSSIEHFGDESEVRTAIEEACRVLKPGGVAAISSEYKIAGEGDGFVGVQLFDRERLQRVWLDGLPWTAVDFLDESLDDTEFIDFERYVADQAYQSIAHPHIKLDNGKYQWTSVHLTFVKDK